MRRFLRGLVAGAPGWWAVPESALLGGIAFALLLVNHARLTGAELGQGIFFTVPFVALWYALRLRLPDGRWWQRALWEMGWALFLSIVITAGWLALASVAGWWEVLDGTRIGLLGIVLLLLSGGVQGLAFRVMVHFLHFWISLQRRRLVWALTQTQLWLVLLMALPVAGFLFFSVVQGRPFAAFDTWVFTIFPVLGVVAVFAAVGVAVVLPPALLLAYLTARRTTRRLLALAEAAAALRRGDYAARVEVVGGDEVAQLQADFNAMAEALEGAMADLQAERDKVAELLRSRREMVAGVSHELRTPVATARGYLESALGRWEDEPPPTLRHDLEVLEQEVRRLERLIDDLFTLARLDAEGLALELAPTDVGEVVRRRVEVVAPLAWERDRVEVVADLPRGLPPALADPGRLEQILANLLRNALRHTPPGGIVAVRAAMEGEGVVIVVCDTGEGIAPEAMARIWERFYRGEAARARDGSGAGLGLALVKELVEAMGGTVAVESRPGEGSCFTVRLRPAA